MNFIPSAFRHGGRDRLSSVEDGMSGSTLQPPQTGPPRTPMVMAMDDKLSIFRHMVGIHSTPCFAPSAGGNTADISHNNLRSDGRAAPNLGIYNRVVHREKEAKTGYKLASYLINGCLGIQVIVAASLTAMGAANSSNIGVTAFGAINTVIAGILTYLKGSGLPNRIRYYENEWKKVREYIEQRERDFSRPDCPLDVYEVVRVIESMYDEVKSDVQTNTPDSYVSVSDIRKRNMIASPQIPKMGEHLSPYAKKFQDMETKYGPKVAEFVEGLAHKEEERLKQMEKVRDLEKGLETKGKEFERDIEARGRDLEKGIETRARDFERDIEARGRDLGKGMEARGKDFEREIEAQGREFESRGRPFEKDIEDRGRAVEKDMESRGSRIMGLGRDFQRQGDRVQSSISRLGGAVDDEIRAIKNDR